jgi:hypothetical protein
VTAVPNGLKFKGGHWIYITEILKESKIGGRGRKLAALEN